MEDDREKVLASVRRHLRGTEKYIAARDARSPLVTQFGNGFDFLFQKFSVELSRLGGEAVAAATEIEAAHFITSRIDPDDSVFIYDDVANKKTSLTAALRESRDAGMESQLASGYEKTEAARFGSSVSGCTACIAETGTVVMNTGLRLPASLAAKLFVVVDPVHLLPTLDELFSDRFTNFVGSSMFLITGPSRTADIEKQLVKGVHGPKEVFVIFLQQ